MYKGECRVLARLCKVLTKARTEQCAQWIDAEGIRPGKVNRAFLSGLRHDKASIGLNHVSDD
jgi:hypothetical protein